MAEGSGTNAAWLRLFEHFDIRSHLKDHGIFRISARSIKKLGDREPRLMTKFDHRKSRPKIMQDLGITVLPVTNGEYVLLSGDGYCLIPEPNQIERYNPAKIGDFQTLNWKDGLRSEPQVIDTLFCSSALRSFIGDQDLTLTVRGRLRARPFSFAFATQQHGDKEIDASGVQIEIDSGYEGDCIAIVEAKFGATSDIIVRQLFYPYRHMLESGVSKKLHLVYLIYSNKVFSLYEVAFENPHQYHSCRIVRQKHYTLEVLKKLQSFADVVASAPRSEPGAAPFPQADDASKIIDVVELVLSNPMSKVEIGEYLELDPRQGDYYGNAVVWLGFAEKSGEKFHLTQRGVTLAHMNRADRIAFLAETVAGMPVFRDASRAQAKGERLSTDQIAKLITKNTTLQGTTPPRRASTVRSWIDWLANQLGQKLPQEKR